jgi:hypothetical protein
MAQVVECLPSKFKGPCSNPSTKKNATMEEYTLYDSICGKFKTGEMNL